MANPQKWCLGHHTTFFGGGGRHCDSKWGYHHGKNYEAIEAISHVRAPQKNTFATSLKLDRFSSTGSSCS
jgi:hypothetical protein